ncbi:TonB-dependent receptor [Salinimicrobium terrae]|uniref:TonB-dependent receptor n=1 Tax=Salinimicrobium terrae TaxID=470866 RepID=UPI0003FA9FA9|nr:TonB-dependent receptor [Salinimicrobium terrae]
MRKFLALALFLTSATIFAQTTLTGKVVEAETGVPIPGVNINVDGTVDGTVTDFNGLFSFETEISDGTLVLSYVGFSTLEIPYNGTTDFGTLVMEPSATGLEEVIITSYNLAIDRKTPVAVSTIRSEEIENRLGNQEFPEILKTTPGVYATKSGGGFGDAEMRLRGFNSENIAVLINGVPINGMENGRVYWSNWAGLSDVTRIMQVQRGLGASRVAVPSVGGTINIITKTTDAEEGGNVFMSAGNDGYKKYGFTLSTGQLDNGFAATVAASQTTGEGYIDGTPFEAYSYFVNIAKDFSENHKLSFTAFGAPQEHGQRFDAELISTYRQSDRGVKFNRDFGYRNGEAFNASSNFYHKPQMSLNHYWTISDATSLSTAVYASYGTGGGTYMTGVDKSLIGTFNNPSEYRFGFLQPLNYDMIVSENMARGALGSETIIVESRNDHEWYGALSTLSTDLTPDIEFIGGLDFRYYEGQHWQEVNDLLGGQYFLDDNSDVNNPNNVALAGEKINYYDKGFVLWGGGFAQAEYSRDDLSAFVSVAASNTSYKRRDFFNFDPSDPARETDWVNFFGYSGKTGANFNITNNHNVFANIGYFEKAPFLNAVINFTNEVNEDAPNQKIFSAELGYGFRSEKLSGTLNIYRTNWLDRTETRSFNQPDGTTGFANILGINALHQGVELDFTYRPMERLEITGMASIGDWRWEDDVTGVEIYDEAQELQETINIYIADLKVGDAAQTAFGLGVDFEAIENVKLRANYNYYDNFYADYNPVNRTSELVGQAWQVPAYGVLDLGMTYTFDFGGFETVFNANMNNALDTEYIADARDVSGTYEDARVWYGFGRTFNLGAKINF